MKNWDNLTPNEQELYRELSKKIDNLKYVVFLLCGLMACVVWMLWKDRTAAEPHSALRLRVAPDAGLDIHDTGARLRLF